MTSSENRAVSWILWRVSDCRAAGDVDLAGGAGARCRIGFQRSLAKSREAWVACHTVHTICPVIDVSRWLSSKSGKAALARIPFLADLILDR